MHGDKAGKNFWDRRWTQAGPPRPVDPEAPGWSNHISRAFAQYFRRTFVEQGLQPGDRCLELGCAQSQWLAFFKREFQLAVTGIDYSETGCEQSRELLNRQGVEGEIVHADLFHPPEHLLGVFDIVFSAGLAEHFEDTAACLRTFARYLRPGGIMLTTIPNLAGVVGHLQRWLWRPVYDIHTILNAPALSRAHLDAGLDVLACDYFIFAHFGLCSLDGMPTASVERLFKRTLIATATRLSAVFWLLDSNPIRWPPNETTSPYVVCLARKRGQPDSASPVRMRLPT